MNNKINKITIFPGINKSNKKEGFENIEIKKEEVIAIVGSTGSGKSQLLYDVEKLTQGDTKSKRKIFVNNEVPKKDWRFDPRQKLIASLSQSMNFLTDSSVEDFLKLHMRARGKKLDEKIIDLVIEEANEITGEPISKKMNLLSLSGGQTRALMVADIASISTSPIILIDEIENAGIKKEKAIDILIKEGKIVLLVTHDPILALNANKRVVLENGGITKVLETTEKEKNIAKELNKFENLTLSIREDIRAGKTIEKIKLEFKEME